MTTGNLESVTGWRVRLCTGAVLAAVVCAAVRVDILNNAAYGLTVSHELATILVLAALGVVALPTVASILGWSWHLRITVIVCVVLTVWSAINAYSARQSAAILSAQSAEHKYEAAKADADEARKILARITETGDVVELGELKDAASLKLAQSCRKPKSESCTLAEADVKTLTIRLSDAKARDEAKEALKLAKSEGQAGPAEASMVATVIAQHTGADAASMARNIALILTGVSIAFTQLVALMGGYAASLISGAMRTRQQAAPKVIRQVKPQGFIRRTRQPAALNVVQLDPARASIKAWLDSATVSGGGMRGGDALKAYKRFAGHTAEDTNAGEFRQHLAAILGTAAIVARNSGYVVRGLELRTTPNVHAVIR